MYNYELYSSTTMSHIQVLSCAQDTIVALEALAEYDMKKPAEVFNEVEAEFFVSGRSDKEELLLKDPTDKVVAELQVLYSITDTPGLSQ